MKHKVLKISMIVLAALSIVLTAGAVIFKDRKTWQTEAGEEHAISLESMESTDSAEYTESTDSSEETGSEESAENAENAESPAIVTVQNIRDPEKQRKLEEARKYLGFGDIFEGIRSRAAILVRYRNDYLGGVVAEMNADEILDPASTTKLMTALVMAEHLVGTDTLIEIPGDVFWELDYWGASTSGFDIGEQITPEDCLHGILMKSGADACYAAARAVSGDEDIFVELMNQKAEEVGMINSHYMNVTGLGISGHYTCARDMVKLLQACYENEAVREALCCLHYTSAPTPEHPEGLKLENNMLKWERSDRDAGNPVVVIGSKTGFITAVGQNLCSVLQVNEEEIYFLVTMGAPGNNFDGETVHYEDQSLIMDRLTAKYEKGLIHREPLPE